MAVGISYKSNLWVILFFGLFTSLAFLRLDFHPANSLGAPKVRNKYRAHEKDRRKSSETNGGSRFFPKGIQNVADMDAWKKDVDSEVVANAWFSFAGHIVQEFIYDTWYSHLTPDTEFPAEVRALLNAVFGRLAKRAKKVNMNLLFAQILEMVVEQIEIFRDAKEEIQFLIDQNSQECSHELNEKMIRMQLQKDCNLHPSMRTPEGHYEILRRMADCVISYLDTVYADKVLSRVVSRELLAGFVFRKIIQLCTPYNVHKWIIALIEGQIHEKNDLSRPSSDMRGVWQKATKVEQFVAAESRFFSRTQKRMDVSGAPGNIDEKPRIREADSPGPSRQNERPILQKQETFKCKFKGKPVCQVVTAEIVNASGAFAARDFVVYSIRVGDNRGEWTISRRYRHFEQLHRHMRGVKGYDISLPPKRLFFHDLSSSYVESRRQALDLYLQKILNNPEFYSQEFVWEFFKKRSEKFTVERNADSIPALVKLGVGAVVGVTIDATHTVGKGARHGISSAAEMLSAGRKKMRKHENSTIHPVRSRDGDEEVENPEVDPVDILGQLSAPDTSPLSQRSSGSSETESEIEYESFESISISLYELIDCVFRLQDRGFFRKQVFTLYKHFVQFLFGSGIDTAFDDFIGLIKQESMIAKLIAHLQGLLWPAGKFIMTANASDKRCATPETYLEPFDKPPADFHEISAKLRDILSLGPASSIAKLVGRVAYVSGVDDVCSVLSSQTMICQISYGILELLLLHLFPEGVDIIPSTTSS